MAEKPNLKVLKSIRLKGRAAAVGEVIAKADFANKGEWQNLAFGDYASLEETDEKVGVADVAEKATRPAKAGATRDAAAMPGVGI